MDCLESLPYLNPATDRRVCFITGGSSGVGYYTVLHLYLHGYIIYIAGRSKSRVTKSIAELTETADAIVRDYPPKCRRFVGKLNFLELDLCDLNLVQRAVEKFKLLESRLHVLINNAGVMAIPFSMTQDNFEIQLQTNYISPFLLTTLLIPMLENSASTTFSPRIIYLSSVGHKLNFRYFPMDSNFNYLPNFIFTWIRYAKAKTAGIHFTNMLALRNPQILSMSVHPGLVMNTNLFTYWTRLPIVGMMFWCLFQIFGYLFGITPEEGATTVVRCCLDPKLNAHDNNGKYFINGEEASPSKVASDMDYAARTWIWTVHELSERGISIS